MEKNTSKQNNYVFKEKKSTLISRIEAHKKHSKLEINEWILKQLHLKNGEKVLDLGCGTGKQTIPFKKKVGIEGTVIGMDISEELLEEAKKKAEDANVSIQFLVHDANNQFDFEDNYFDVISCCFAIYYIDDLERIMQEFDRILKPGGRLFLAGPAPDNAATLHEFHQKVTGRPLPYMPGVSRFMYEVLPLVRKYFTHVDVEDFQNPISFSEIESFLEYYTSTGLFIKSVPDSHEKLRVIKHIEIELQKIIKEQRKFEVMKHVKGILAYKK
ncbi:MAG: class I SAM-dependent methyltransferase [Candidatus Helarchaeota archaeon]